MLTGLGRSAGEPRAPEQLSRYGLPRRPSQLSGSRPPYADERGSLALGSSADHLVYDRDSRTRSRDSQGPFMSGGLGDRPRGHDSHERFMSGGLGDRSRSQSRDPRGSLMSGGLGDRSRPPSTLFTRYGLPQRSSQYSSSGYLASPSTSSSYLDSPSYLERSRSYVSRASSGRELGSHFDSQRATMGSSRSMLGEGQDQQGSRRERAPLPADWRRNAGFRPYDRFGWK